MQSRHASHYYLWRSKHYSDVKKYPWTKERLTPRWPKLSIVCHCESHLIAGALVTPGPSTDYTLLPPVLRQASRLLHFDRVLADKGYDGESNHIFCREKMGIRISVIPTREGRTQKTRRSKNFIATTRYRRQMQNHFPNRVYGQRVQVESVFSRDKRRFGAALFAKTWASQARECLLRVLTHNLLLVAAV